MSMNDVKASGTSILEECKINPLGVMNVFVLHTALIAIAFLHILKRPLMRKYAKKTGATAEILVAALSMRGV